MEETPAGAGRPPRRRGRAGFAVLLGLGAIALLLLWPRGPRLELYTTPVVTQAGKAVRLQFLVPDGWRLTVFDSNATVRTARGANLGTVLLLGPGPDERLRWAPEWLRERLLAPRLQGEQIILSVVDSAAIFAPNKLDGSIRLKEMPGAGKQPSQPSAWRGLDGAPAASIAYTTPDRAAFDATYQRICGSLRVLR